MKYIRIIILITLTLSLSIEDIGAQINITDSILFQGYNRVFITHLPPGYTGLDSVPLVFVLHGGGGTADGMINFTEFDLVSDTAEFIVVFPQGAIPASSGGFIWADGRGTPADSAGIDDVGFISNLINYFINNYAINELKIYATGMSNGGFMTQRLACELDNNFAAVASVGSTMDSSQVSVCNPNSSIPIMLINGVDDPFVPFNGGIVNGSQGYAISSDSLFKFWFQKNNCTGQIDSLQLPDIVSNESSTITTFFNNNCNCNSKVILYKVYGGGHTWPGVPDFWYELIAGQTNEDIHASVEIWNFFKNFVNCNVNLNVNNYPRENIPIKIYPNPTKYTATIEIENKDYNNLILFFYNSKGKVIQTTNVVSNEPVLFKRHRIKSGLYFVVLRSDKQILGIKKFIIE